MAARARTRGGPHTPPRDPGAACNRSDRGASVRDVVSTSVTPAPRAAKRTGGLARIAGKALGVVGSIVVTIAVAMGAMAYLVVAWGQHARRDARRMKAF